MMSNVLESEPGVICVMEPGYEYEYQLCQADGEGVVRDDEGRCYSSDRFDVVYEIDSCNVCGASGLADVELVRNVLECQECSHFHIDKRFSELIGL